MGDKTLFRTFAGMLWTKFDTGGISVGRSYQATLLEGFMYLFPNVKSGHDIYGDIIKEVDLRIAKKSVAEKSNEKQLLIPFAGLETLSNPEFALLSLNEIHRFLEEEGKALGFLDIETDRTIVRLQKLCQIAFRNISHQKIALVRFDKRAIINEGTNRKLIASKKPDRFRSFKELGINPWTE